MKVTFDEYIEKTFQQPFNNGMKERRCSCGRLLGRFNGQAEVKCPKCGKMNLIGVKCNGKSNNKD